MVEERLLALDWLSPSGPKLTLAGCSLGAAVAIHLAVAHPERIARLNLLAPAGLPEPWYMPAHSVRVAFRILCAALPPSTHLDRLRHVLHVTLTTPDYKCDVEQLVRLAAGGAFDVAVYGAGLDLVHSPHAHFWKSAEAGGGAALRRGPRRHLGDGRTQIEQERIDKEDRIRAGRARPGLARPGWIFLNDFFL